MDRVQALDVALGNIDQALSGTIVHRRPDGSLADRCDETANSVTLPLAMIGNPLDEPIAVSVEAPGSPGLALSATGTDCQGKGEPDGHPEGLVCNLRAGQDVIASNLASVRFKPSEMRSNALVITGSAEGKAMTLDLEVFATSGTFTPRLDRRIELPVHACPDPLELPEKP